MPTNIIESSQEIPDKDFFCLIIILLQSLVICNYNLVTSTWVCSIRILSSVGVYYPAPLALLFTELGVSSSFSRIQLYFTVFGDLPLNIVYLGFVKNISHHGLPFKCDRILNVNNVIAVKEMHMHCIWTASRLKKKNNRVLTWLYLISKAFGISPSILRQLNVKF